MRNGALVWGFAALGLLGAVPAHAGDTVYYYSSDTIHSEVVVTDANRNVVEKTYYAPYGQVLNRDLRDGPGYTGHEEDPETGLVYMQQRYYDPEAGRFLSTDPVQADGGGGSFNRYAYAGDNPYSFYDPDGRMKDQDQERSPGCTGALTRGGCGIYESPAQYQAQQRVSEQRAPIYGTAQNSRNTPTHASTSQRIANEATADSDTQSAHLNQSLRTVTGDSNAPNIRPDVTIVNKSGTIDMYEVRSAGQSRAELISKLIDARAGLGIGGRNMVVEPDPMPIGGGMILRGLGPLGIIEMILHQAAEEHQAEKAAVQQQKVCAPPYCT